MRRVWFCVPLLAACGDRVSSDREAELAYLGLDRAIDRAIGLGFDGFNAADSANIPDQVGQGDVSGTMTVGGQVDQGASDNKEMRLTILLEDYADLVDIDEDDDEDVEITYHTDPDALPRLDLSLRDVPNGTVEGTLVGVFAMEGDVEGEVELDLSLAGDIEDAGGEVQRVDGSIVVTGTVTNDGGGVYEVDLTL